MVNKCQKMTLKELDTLSLAILLAKEKHHGQTDKNGLEYFTHPIRVLCKVDTLEEQIVAVLHDIVEDTDVTLEDLRELKFSPTIIDAIDAISRRRNEQLKPYLRRVRRNRIAYNVKMQDIRDNSNLERLHSLPIETQERLAKKYKFCLEFLRFEA